MARAGNLQQGEQKLRKKAVQERNCLRKKLSRKEAVTMNGKKGESGEKTVSRGCREMEIRETLIKAFPAPDLRREAAYSLANPEASERGFASPPEALRKR